MPLFQLLVSCSRPECAHLFHFVMDTKPILITMAFFWSCSAFSPSALVWIFLRDFFLFPVHRLGRLGIIRRWLRDTFTDDWEFFYDFIIIVVFMEFGFGRILQGNRGELVKFPSPSCMNWTYWKQVLATQSSYFLAFGCGLEGVMPTREQKVVKCLSELLKFIMSSESPKAQGLFGKKMIV